MRNDLIIEDTTLRDGEQAPGIAFNKEAKIQIYNSLISAGIRWLEVGIPAMGGEELETIQILQIRPLQIITIQATIVTYFLLTQIHWTTMELVLQTSQLCHPL